MKASEVIESWVRETAARLPRGKRNDVAFELRALLDDELAAMAQAQGRAADREMAMALLQRFGRPADAAQRYHERPALIESADTHHFLIWSLVGALCVGLLAYVDPDAPARGDLFLQWLGVLVLVFALMGWWRRRRPQALHWSPSRDPDLQPRGLAVLSVLALLAFPISMYAAPYAFVQVAFLGAFPDAEVVLTDAFRHSALRACTMALLIATVVLIAAAAIRGRWTTGMRWTRIAVEGGLAALFLAHATPADGTGLAIFTSPRTNLIAEPIFAAVAALFVPSLLYDLYREWARMDPAPNQAGGDLRGTSPAAR